MSQQPPKPSETPASPSPDQPLTPETVQADFRDPAFVEAFLTHPDIGPISVYLDTVGCVQSWFLHWRHGTMSLQGGHEVNARAAAALFIFLYGHEIEAGLARDLACSYFDPRIGR
jgi:hypothetical protein